MSWLHALTSALMSSRDRLLISWTWKEEEISFKLKVMVKVHNWYITLWCVKSNKLHDKDNFGAKPWLQLQFTVRGNNLWHTYGYPVNWSSQRCVFDHNSKHMFSSPSGFLYAKVHFNHDQCDSFFHNLVCLLPLYSSPVPFFDLDCTVSDSLKLETIKPKAKERCF